MKILLKKIANDTFYDGDKRYWKKISDRLYGYDPLRKTIYDHIYKDESEFEVLDNQEQQTLKSSTEKVIPKKPIENIAPRDRGKPSSYVDPNMIAYTALTAGD